MRLIPESVRSWWQSRPIQPGPLETWAATPDLDVRSAGAAIIPYTAGKPTWPKRDPRVFAEQGYERLALVFRCVQVLAASAAAAPMKVYDEATDDEIPDHPLRQLLRRPNPGMWESRYWSFVTMCVSVAGFCVVEKERADGGRVVNLNPLRPDWCRPVPRDQAPPDWEYRVPGYREPFRLRSDDVLVYTYADTPDRWPCGIGPLEVLLREVGQLNAMSDFLKSFFDHGTVPIFGIIPDVPPGAVFGQKEADALKAAWVQRTGGLNKANEPAVLASVKDVKRLGFDFNELAWVDLRDLSDLAICQAFGIHPAMVGARVGLEHSDSRANAAEARRGFYEDTVVPLWDRLDGVTTLGLLPEFDTRPNVALRFDSSDIPALQEDRNARASWVVQATLGGAMSVHRMHLELGLPEPEGDDYYLRSIAQSAVPASDPMDEERPKPTPPPFPPPNQPPPDDEDDNDDQRAMRAYFARPTPTIRLHLNGHGPAERRAAIGQHNRAMIGRVADRATPQYRAFFRAQGRRIAEAATRAAVVDEGRRSAVVGFRAYVRAPIGPIPPLYDMRDLSEIDWDEEERRLLQVLTRNHQLAGETAFAAVNDALSTSIAFDLANPNVRNVLDRLALRVVGISDETRRDVARIVGEALDEGTTVPDLAKRLRGLFEETYANRSITIARTESMTAYGEASVLGYRETGLVEAVELLDNPAHDTDPGSDGLTCAQRNGLIVPLDQARTHIEAEHPNGTLAVAPVLVAEA
jgi:HK97 family phage portal protein